MKKFKQTKGFSLVEMLVAVSIFSVVAVLIADIFVITNKAQRRSEINQKIQSDARVMMAQINDRIRFDQIDYMAYGGALSVDGEEAIRLLTDMGQSVIIQKSDTEYANTSCPGEKSTPCLEISLDGGVTFTAMSSDNFRVPHLKFYIQPLESPSEKDGDSYKYNQQPMVTMVIGIKSVAPGAEQVIDTQYFQSTTTSRVLLR